MILILFFASSLHVAVSQSLPMFIAPCKNDWKLNRCAITAGNIAIPYLAVGDSALTPIDPLQLITLKVLENSSSAVKANMTFKDLYAYGLANSKITRSDINLNARHMVWSVRVPRLLLGFKYKINGWVNTLPIIGEGSGVIELDDMDLIYLLDFGVSNISGIEYVDVVHTEIRQTAQYFQIQLNGLFNGNKLNTLLNENWRDLNKQLGPAISKALVFSLKPTVDYILTLVPFNVLFP